MTPRLDPGCLGKTRYLSKAAALQVIDHRKRERRCRPSSGRKGIHPYRCGTCKHWHIGSNPL